MCFLFVEKVEACLVDHCSLTSFICISQLLLFRYVLLPSLSRIQTSDAIHLFLMMQHIEKTVIIGGADIDRRQAKSGCSFYHSAQLQLLSSLQSKLFVLRLYYAHNSICFAAESNIFLELDEEAVHY
jgi:hypothetical protein